LRFQQQIDKVKISFFTWQFRIYVIVLSVEDEFIQFSRCKNVLQLR